jgi:hypothetical protein
MSVRGLIIPAIIWEVASRGLLLANMDFGGPEMIDFQYSTHTEEMDYFIMNYLQTQASRAAIGILPSDGCTWSPIMVKVILNDTRCPGSPTRWVDEIAPYD